MVALVLRKNSYDTNHTWAPHNTSTKSSILHKSQHAIIYHNKSSNLKSYMCITRAPSKYTVTLLLKKNSLNASHIGPSASTSSILTVTHSHSTPSSTAAKSSQLHLNFTPRCHSSMICFSQWKMNNKNCRSNNEWPTGCAQLMTWSTTINYECPFQPPRN